MTNAPQGFSFKHCKIIPCGKQFQFQDVNNRLGKIGSYDVIFEFCRLYEKGKLWKES